MSKAAKPSGKETLATASTASPKSKQAISLVNFPLTPAEDVWLRQQRKRVAEVFQQSLSETPMGDDKEKGNE